MSQGGEHDDGLMMDQGTRHIPLSGRLRRGLFGYRTGDVEAAFEHLGWQLDGLASSDRRLYTEREELLARVEENGREQDRALRDQAACSEAAEQERAAVQRAHADRHLAEARAAAAKILAAAEEQAAILRHEAGLRVGDAASRLEDLLKVREQLLGEVRGLIHAYADVLEEHEGGPIERPSRTREPVRAPAPLPELGPVAAQSGLFPTHVELDAGPFADFAELSAFERALARLPKVEDVYVRGFGDERAAIELVLTEETPLAHDLVTMLPYGLRVERSEEGRRLHLEILPEQASGTGA